MFKLMTPLLLTSILFAENTPNLTQQLQNVDQEQASMLDGFAAIKKKREIAEIKAQKIEDARLAKVTEEKRLKALQVEKAEVARLEAVHQNELKIAEEKREILLEQERKAEDARKEIEAKKIAEAQAKKDELAKVEAQKKKAAIAKKKAEATKRANAKLKVEVEKKVKVTTKVKPKPVAPKVVKETSGLDVLNAILDAE